MTLADAGKRSKYGKIANTPAAVKAMASKLVRNGHALRFCYAGPCGYGIQRQLTVCTTARGRSVGDPPQAR